MGGGNSTAANRDKRTPAHSVVSYPARRSSSLKLMEGEKSDNLTSGGSKL